MPKIITSNLKNQLLIPCFSMTILLLCACSQQNPQTQTLTTIADARDNPAQITDIGETGDSVGDILIFEQPLLDKNMKKIGINSGNCIRTSVTKSFQCQWTLTFVSENEISGSIQVAGREYDKGTSTLSIIGGTGHYFGISGEMKSTNNNDGTFTQVLHYRIEQ